MAAPVRLTKKLRAAAQKYIDLQDRRVHPGGKFDHAQRWKPDRELACCALIRSPSRAYPYSLMTHCRSLTHVAAETGYTVTTLRQAVARLRSEDVEMSAA
jgi:hypothetical protein